MRYLIKILTFVVLYIFCFCLTVRGLTTYHHKPMFSIIVSNYNYANYLPQTILSILNSTYPDFELILINDGSTDNSLDVMNYFAQKDKRIKVIDQSNQGLSAARNHGIAKTKGAYLWFVDADDWIDRTALEKLNQAIIKSKKATGILPDLVSFYIQPTDSEGQKEEPSFYSRLPKQIETHTLYPYDGSKLSFGVIASFPATSAKQIYRHEFIKQKEILFPVGLYFEDECFFMTTLLTGAKGIALPEYIYYKREHSASITHNRPKYYGSTVRLPIVAYKWLKQAGVAEDKARQVFHWHFGGVFIKWPHQKQYLADLNELLSFIQKQPTDEFWIEEANRLQTFIKEKEQKFK